MEFRVLGPIEVEVDHEPIPLGGPKQRTVAARLIASVGQRVSTESLLAVLYPERAPSGGRRSVQTYVSNLRRHVGDAIRPTPGGYVLDVPPASVDAVRFEQAYDTATALAEREPDAAARLLREALSWWRGHAYADVAPDGTIGVEITRLHELRLAATEARIDADLELGRHAAVLAELEALVADHPLRERFHAQRVVALYRAERQADALAAVAAVRTRLGDELGLDPGDELRTLEQRILAQDPGLRLPRRTVARSTVLVCDLDPDRWDREDTATLVRRRDELLRAHAERSGATLEVHGTAVVATMGDVGAAVDTAAALARGDLGARVALDHGDVETSHDHEVTGPPVTRAARVLALAHPGQVLLTDAAQRALATQHLPGRTLTSLGAHDVAGLAEPVALFQLVGDGLPGPFPPLCRDRLPPPIALPGIGSLPGHELREPLGGNRLGALHVAYQPALGREVVVRLLSPAVVAEPGFVRTFEVEAQRLARLAHPNLVGLLDHWRDGDQAVLVHRSVDGRPLDEVLRDGPLATGPAVELLERVAGALTHAHARGVVHGRLDAGNVLVEDGGDPWVCDLGLAQVCASTPGVWVHDLAAPEVLAGERATVRTDVHDFGLLAHHVLSGEPAPPDGALPPLDGPLDEVVARATAVDPDRRYASTGDVVAALRAATGREGRPVATADTRNPYRGLETFTELDAGDFHGRDGLVEELLAVLSTRGAVAAVGPSGIGKSSVVRAGLVPAIRRGRLDGVPGGDVVVADLTPGDAPVARLGAAIRRVAARPLDGLEAELEHARSGLARTARAALPDGAVLVVLVDQLEELFTGTVDDVERRTFLTLLTEAMDADGPVRVVLTLRADVFDRPLEYPAFGDALRRCLVAVPAPGPDELAEIVRRPAEDVGVEVHGALVARVVADAEGEVGALPLVEHLMTELFAQRRGPRLTLDDYLAAGGLRGAIGRRAEQVFEGLDDDQQALVRPLLLQLVAIDEDGVVARRRVAVPTLATTASDATAVATVTDRFTAARLLTTDRDPTTRTPTVEVAHEALIREWSRLATWIEDARTALVQRHRLETAAAEWEASGRDDSALLRGGRLEVAESLVGDPVGAVPDHARRYVERSRTQQDADEARSARRRRRTTRAIAAAAVVALALASVATVQWRDAAAQRLAADQQRVVADEQRGEAERQRSVASRTAATAQIRALTATADDVRGDDAELATLLALEAVEQAAAIGADELLPSARRALEVSAQAITTTWRRDAADLGGMAVSPDERLIAGPVIEFPSLAPTPVVRVLSAGTGQTVHEWDLGAPVAALDFADADTLVVLFATARDGDPPRAQLLDVATGTLGEAFARPDIPSSARTPLDGVAVDPVGRLVVVRSAVDDSAVVWDLPSREVLRTSPPGHPLVPIGGQRSVVELDGTSATTLDLDTGERGPPIAVEYVGGDVEADHGLLAVYGLGPDSIEVYDLTTGEHLVSATTASPSNQLEILDATHVVSGENAAYVSAVDVGSGTSHRIQGPVDGSFWMDSTADGSALFLASQGGSLWRVDPGRVGPPANRNVQLGSRPAWIRADDDVGTMAVNTDDSGTLIVDTVDATSVRSRTDPGRTLAAVFGHATPDGSVVAWVDDQTVGRIVLATGEELELGWCENVRSLTRDGRYAIVEAYLPCETLVDEPGPAYVLDLETGERPVDLGRRPIVNGDVTPPGTQAGDGVAAVNVAFESIELYDVATGDLLASHEPGVAGLLGGRVADDGSVAVYGSTEGLLTVVDIDGLRHDGTFDPDRHVRTLDNAVGGSVALNLSIVDGMIATGDSTGTVRLFELDGTDLVTLEVADGKRPAAAIHRGQLWYGDDGTVLRRMPIDVDEHLALARSRLTRTWTADECERYAIEDCDTDLD